MNESPEVGLLEALRHDREVRAPDDARARVASRVGLASVLPPPSPRLGASMRVAGVSGRTAGWLAAAFVLGGVVGALLHARLATAPPPRIVYVDRPVAVNPVASAPPPPSAASALPDPTLRPPPKEGAAASPASPRIPQLDAERALLDAARVALVSGDSDTAVRALERHARTYARPILGEERDALFVQALVRAGRYDEARVRAEAFRRKAPSSLFLSAVDAAIASIP